MKELTGYERMSRILKHEPVDRIGIYEHYWGDTHREWVAQGWVKPDDDFTALFNYDMRTGGALSLVADLDFKAEVIEETEDTVVMRDGNGAVLRRHKHHDTTPEHIDFLVKDRVNWEKYIKPKLTPDVRRINFESYRKAKALAKAENRFFVFSAVNVFELMHPVCGHEYMLMGMALDPEWVEDMVTTYSKLLVSLQEILFEKEGLPDAIWYYEDMGYKESPFMSPSMYRELVMPGHKRTFDYAHSLGLDVIVHSCGFVEPLIPDMIKAGMNMLQVIEVKAGMDLLRIHKNFGDKISLMGGIDVRALYSNDYAVIDRELESKIPTVKNGFGYMLHSDHSIPKTVTLDSYRHFIEYGLELGTY